MTHKTPIHIVIVSIAITILWLSTAIKTQAAITCSPQPFDIKEKFGNSELVFLGKTQKITQNEIEFTPIIIWKGSENIPETITAKMVMFEYDQTKKPELNKEYLIFSEKLDSNKFTLTPCNYFGKKEEFEGEITKLNTITPGIKQPFWERMIINKFIAGGIIAALLVVVVGVEVIIHRHKSKTDIAAA